MSAIRTFFLALVGGGLFSFIHVPLPWTLGPIAAVSLTALVTGRQQYWPRWVREIALIVLGYAMGRPFTLETGQAIISQLPIMLAATFLATFFVPLFFVLINRLGRQNSAAPHSAPEEH